LEEGSVSTLAAVGNLVDDDRNDECASVPHNAGGKALADVSIFRSAAAEGIVAAISLAEPRDGSCRGTELLEVMPLAITTSSFMR
jgi:hypothetical protein